MFHLGGRGTVVNAQEKKGEENQNREAVIRSKTGFVRWREAGELNFKNSTTLH